MKRILFAVLLIAAEVSSGQTPDIYRYPQIQAHKVNFFIDTLTGNVFGMHSIDSSIKAGTGIGLVRDSVVDDTAYQYFFFLKSLEETDFYKKLMGQQFPPFVMGDLTGQDVNCNNFKGKIVLVNFWATTCAPCIAEMPILNQLVDSLKNGPFVFIAPAMDDSAEVVKFLKDHPFKYDVLPGAKGFSDAIGIRAYPTNVIIDKSGKVVSVLEGVNLDSVTHKLLTRQEINSVLRNLSGSKD